MTICGLKLTHDGAVAVIRDGKLLFSYEMEKLRNNARYSDVRDLSVVEEILDANGLSLADVDQLVIDGWGQVETAQDVFIWKGSRDGKELQLPLGKYGHLVINQPLLQRTELAGSDGCLTYSSYMHVAGHVAGAYCTSGFAAEGESSFVLVWDGGMTPQLFYVDREKGRVENCRPLFLLNGNIYCFFAQRFPPFDKTKPEDIGIGGKVMAYIGLGQPRSGLLHEFNYIYRHQLDKKRELTGQVVEQFAAVAAAQRCSPEDAMATFHLFLEELLISSLREKVARYSGYVRNICLSGGCALNIKWNQAIRYSGVFDRCWVPPFPNDSGSAIGTACCEMVVREGWRALDWNVYTGPAINPASTIDEGWVAIPYTIRQLAGLIHYTHRPVVLLDGRAELGPRALGNRSIIAPATDSGMKDLLNRMKGREGYRPVAPICLEEDAPDIFDPGLPDPYMLYDHFVREGWKTRIPAILHLDGSARLQTVAEKDNPRLYALLQEYKTLSDIPVLCNTSANFNGKGFFPDVESAMRWGRAGFVWNDGCLYVKRDLLPLAEQPTQAMVSSDDLLTL